MSDQEALPERTTPAYQLYQREIFLGGTQGKLPNFNTEPFELEKKAKEKLAAGGWYYASANAGLGWTHVANREAFYKYRIVPRMGIDTNTRDISTHLFGHKINAPICFAPVGVNKIYHPHGEIPVAQVAGELGLPYCLSTAGSSSIEDVGKANGKGPRFFQLYAPHDEKLLESLLSRAYNSGFDVCMITLDTPSLAWRHDDVANANYAPYYGRCAELGLTDPVFQEELSKRGIVPGRSIEDDEKAGQTWIDKGVWHGKSHSWAKVKQIAALWKKISGGRPFLVKGVQCAADAKKVAEIGCDGVVVSNHAGRQVDGAVASLDALKEIVDAMQGQPEFTILYDSGIRCAADIFKAMALGAKAVLIGRLWIFGLSIEGYFGVNHVIKSLLAELDILMNVAGYNSWEDVTRDALRLADSPNGGAASLTKARL